MKSKDIANMNKFLPQIREKLERNFYNENFKFEYFECSNARHYINKKAFPKNTPYYRKRHFEFTELRQNDFLRANLIRLIFIDLLILDLK